MNINQLIYRNLKKNIKNYYLYVFALIFSVALYFAFVTLQYDPAMDETKDSIKGAAAIKTASVFLIIIVSTFLLYANTMFIKRRSKEIGLFQLIGMTKGKIFQILSIENVLLYFGSMFIGILLGFSVSRLIMMILIKITGIEAEATLSFSTNAFIQTIIVFLCIYLLIMLMNFIFIKRQSILSLFQIISSTEQRITKMSILQIIIGILGIGFISFGYYLSSRLFSGDFVGMNELFIAMATILGSVILGTYLFYKGSVSFIFNLIRKKKDGYVNINDVLSLSSIMFRMKSNSLLLTIITTVSALAIGLLSLSYISYYSAEKTAEQSVPNHFSIPDVGNAKKFTNKLERNQIDYSSTQVQFILSHADISNIIEGYDETNMNYDTGNTTMTVISEYEIDDLDIQENETIFINSNDALLQFMSFKDSGDIKLSGKNQSIELDYLRIEDKSILPTRITGGGFPVAVVDHQVFLQLLEDIDPSIQGEFTEYVGVDITQRNQLDHADEIFQETIGKWAGHESRLEVSTAQKQNMGLIMFIVGFLGLSFLVTSGCILYFKQMDESEEEKSSYTILRKLGFTQRDLLRGIRAKQLINFGIPLLVGLSHSYFAVKSGWFFFGTELWAPMIIVMLLYAVLYSIFAILSVLYYKRVIKEAL
ncbi:FtsX-like permease family protein [Ornithinibacillus sp. L9]|uniref:FtsX-like permease family protein n=1 Tax=Ornithinibacillus caprae TaxID=2678566 RepID=A0A6N8FHT4_9BACI|nr:ABC transporter permease [Ornithinibacillus caprae]MUK88256.1 FtsX-like permease family protein [Ornithinibacillus caprae]